MVKRIKAKPKKAMPATTSKAIKPKTSKAVTKAKSIKAKVQPKAKRKAAYATKNKPLKRPQKAIHLSDETQNQMATTITQMMADLFIKQAQEFDKMLNALKEKMQQLFTDHALQSSSKKSGEQHSKKTAASEGKQEGDNHKFMPPAEQETG